MTTPSSTENLDIDGLAVLVVDMQPDFGKDIDPEIWEMIISSQKQLLKRCINLQVPIAIIEFNPARHGNTLDCLADIAKRDPRTLACTKHGISAFERVELYRWLIDLNISKVLVVGVTAGMCVFETAHDAWHHKLEVHVSAGLMADETGRNGPHDLSKPRYLKFATFHDGGIALARPQY